VGNQTGVVWVSFCTTDNLAAAHRAMASRGVKFLEEPRSEAYGVSRLHGPLWQQVGPNPAVANQ